MAQLQRELVAARAALVTRDDTLVVYRGEVHQLQESGAQTSRELAIAQHRLEQVETLLGESEERYAQLQQSSVYREEMLQDDARRLSEELMKTSRRFNASRDSNVSVRQAAAVLALHLVGQSKPAELLESLEAAAAKLGVSPERFDGFREAVSQALNDAFSFYTSTRWPAQRAADLLMSDMGADSALDMIESVLSLMTELKPSDKPRRSDVSSNRPSSPATPGMGGAAGG